MSPAPATTSAPGTAAPGAVRPWYRNRLLWVVLALVALLLLGRILFPGQRVYSQPLDPQNPRSAGAQAVSRVLADHGIEVRIARGEAALKRIDVDARTTVVVPNPADLGRSTLATLRAQDPQALIVLLGDTALTADLTGERPGAPTSGLVAARCEDPLLRGLTLSTGLTLTYALPGTSAADPCFSTASGTLLLHDRHDARTQMFAAGDVFTNSAVLDADNAAVAVRLLGQRDRLVWYVADTKDTVQSDGRSLWLFLPPWTGSVLALLVLAFGAFVLWRGRRLGPLVIEPLPVTVRAIETTESRGRMYHRVRDRDHAARVLGEASLRRLRKLLNLPKDAPAEQVAELIALRHDREPDQVLALLRPPALPDDSALARLGHDLLTLENEVRTR